MAEPTNRARRKLLTWRNTERAALLLLWLVLVVASSLGYFGRDDWRLDLFANFRMQYYFGALALCVVTAWRGYRILVGLGLTVLLWNGVIIFNFNSRITEDGTSVYRALSANVFTQNHQFDRVEAWIREQEPDFVGLIEITEHWEPTLERLKDILPYRQTRMWGGRYGAVVLSRYPPHEREQSYGFAGIGSLPFFVETPDGPLCVLLMHPLSPTSARAWEWRGHALRDLANYAATVSSELPVLVLGDMNTTPWSPFYQDFVSRSTLDPVVTGFLPRRTWPTQNALLWIPIDHFFLSDQLGAINQWTGPDLGSDHYPIGLDFCMAPQRE